MKGVKLCFGLLLASLITLGASCVVSSDVSALKYNVTKIPLYSPLAMPYYPNFYQAVPGGFEMVTSELDFNKLPSQFIISMTDPSNSDSTVPCVPVRGLSTTGRAYANMPQTSLGSFGNDTTYISNFSFYGFDDIIPPNSSPCGSTKPLFTNNNLITPTANLFPMSVRGDVKNVLPYRFSYDGFYVSDSYKSSEGLIYNSKFDLIWTLFNPKAYDKAGNLDDHEENIPDKIYDLYIPIGTGKTSVVDSYYEGMPIQFNGEFILDPESWDLPDISGDEVPTFGLSLDTDITLEQYYGVPGSYQTSIYGCDYSFFHDDPYDNFSPFSLKYSCDVDLGLTTSGVSMNNYEGSFPWFRLHVHFVYNNENTKLKQFIYESNIVITDNDDTPGGDFDNPVQGSDVESAPGSAYTELNNDSEPDFFASLIDLFNFNLINPFASLFALFAADSCVNIPTLAVMLHSNEIVVCPWFPSTVRGIVTPVIGISSVMLLFGFAVRWLGARSGNFIEDSGGMDSGGYHFENKFRRRTGR